MKHYEVIVLRQARDFIVTLEVKFRSKTYRAIELLKEFGPFLREPYAKKMAGTKDLFELRVRLGNNINRLFYFHDKANFYVITSGYIKKSQKADHNEISRALHLMKQYKEQEYE